jgi:DNA (cytosine-5)-methyltransferase 1
MTLNVVSLFSGCGGADLGLIGGFNFLRRSYTAHNTRIIHASDFDAKAVSTYNLNFAHPAQVLDVRDLDLEGVRADLLVGGFPCQSFSTLNPTKDPTDSRGQLYLEMVRVIQQVSPKMFIAENVMGFARLGGGKYLDAAVAEFESCGYAVQHQILNAADYGIPQLRKRLFIVGVRSDIKRTFRFPEATHGEVDELQNYVPLSRVIESLEPRDPKYFFSQRAVEGVKRAKRNMKRAVAQDLKRPCLTITSHLAKVSLNSRDPVLLVDGRRELYRRFTPREAASIQSFPKSFKFAGSDADAYRQIGNAIPPVLMWHLTSAVTRCLSSDAQSSAA